MKSILEHICVEEVRFLPVIACAFADDSLEKMFRREIPGNVLGGIASMLNSFGSLSSFSQRLQIAHAFGWMSSDLLEEFNKLRRIRNDISHSWDVNRVVEELNNFISKKMDPLETSLDDGSHLKTEFWKLLSLESRFRIRIIWLTGRFYYDSQLYTRAVKQRLNPVSSLYGNEANCLLVEISGLCLDATRAVIGPADGV